MRLLVAVAVLGCTGCAATWRAAKYPPTAAGLTPAARQALAQGMVAPDPKTAIGFFEDARKLSPRAPELYFDLGVAESRLPGRELRAMAWLGAYLAAAPQAANAHEVKDEIAALAATSRKKTALLLELMRFIAGQGVASEASGDFKRIAVLEVKQGDLAAARKTLAFAAGSDRDWANDAVAEALAADGDVAGAIEVGRLIENKGVWAKAALVIAHAQLKKGDLAAARATFIAARAVNEDSDGAAIDARVAFAIAQAAAGDAAGAHETIAPLPARVSKETGYSRGDALVKLAAVTAILDGDPGQALALAAPEDRDRLTAETAERVARAGKIDLARRIAARIGDLQWAGAALGAIARVQAAAGDLTGAVQTLGPHADSWTLRELAELQLRNGDGAGARARLLASRAAALKHERADGRVYELVATARTQLKAGDGFEAARTLDLAEDACGQVPWNEEVGIRSAGSDQRMAQSALAAATRLLGRVEGPAFEYLELLDTPLGAELFLDFDHAIRAPPSSGNPQRDFEALAETVTKVADAQNALEALLRVQLASGR